MVTRYWGTPTAWVTAAASVLDSLANGAGTYADIEIDNTGTRYTHAQINLSIPTSIAPTVGGGLPVYILPRNADGSTYPVTAVANAAAPGLSGTIIVLTTATNSINISNPPFRIGPDVFKVGVVNRSGVGFPATGNLIMIRRMSEEIV